MLEGENNNNSINELFANNLPVIFDGTYLLV